MSTPNNPYNGNPYNGDPYQGGRRPASDETQPYGQEPVAQPAPDYGQTAPSDYDQPAQQPYGAPQEQPTQVMPDYGQGANPYAQEQPTQAFDYGQAQQPYGDGGQIPPQVPPQGPAYGYVPQNPNDKWNGLVIAGFVCAFIVPIVGLILSIVGMVQINKNGGKSKGMAIAGIIVSVVAMIINAVVVFSLINAAANLSTPTSTPTSSGTHSSQPRTTEPDDDLDLDDDWDALDDDLDVLEDDTDALRGEFSGKTLEELSKDPEFQSMIDSSKDSLPEGTSVDVSAQGNTMTYELTIAQSLNDEEIKQMQTLAEVMFKDQMGELAGELNKELDTNDVKMHVVMKTADGRTILDQTYTAQ